jgi:hypothetical protein
MGAESDPVNTARQQKSWLPCRWSGSVCDAYIRAIERLKAELTLHWIF